MWNEILAGLAGGAQGGVQGLGLIQDQRQQQLQNQLRERQAKFQEDEARRQAVKQAWDTMQEGHTFEAPEQAQQFVELGYGVVKGPDGRPMKPKSLQTLGLEKQNQLNDLKYQTAVDQQKLRQSITADTWNQPIEERMALDVQLGGDFEPQTPGDKARDSAQVQAAIARGQLAAAESARRQSRWETEMEFKRQQAEFAKQSKMTPSDYQLLQQAVGMAKANPIAAMDPETLWQTTMANYQQLKGTFPGAQPQQPTQAAPLVGPPGSGSKYTRIQ